MSCRGCYYEFKSYASKTVQPIEKEAKGMKPFEVVCVLCIVYEAVDGGGGGGG